MYLLVVVPPIQMENTMSKNHSNTIRNIGAFLKSYTTSESFKRSLTRQPSFDEHKIRDRKGEFTYRDNFKFNQIAVALDAALNK